MRKRPRSHHAVERSVEVCFGQVAEVLRNGWHYGYDPAQGWVAVGNGSRQKQAGKCGFCPSIPWARTPRWSSIPLTDEQLGDWRFTIEQLAVDFLHGRADVNPRDIQDTCEHCSLATLCRINERAEVASLL